MPNNCLSVLYKHIIQVENKNVWLKVGRGGTNIPLPPPPPPPAQSKKGGHMHPHLPTPSPYASYASASSACDSLVYCLPARPLVLLHTVLNAIYRTSKT